MLEISIRQKQCIAICRQNDIITVSSNPATGHRRSCQLLITSRFALHNQTPNGGFRLACEVKTRTFYPRTTFCRPGVSRSPLREIFHRVFGITKKYRPTMHPKCAAALADKDGENLIMLKGRTEVATRKWEDLHKKRDRRNAVSYCFLYISIRNKPICYVHPASTNHQGQAVHCRINSFGK